MVWHWFRGGLYHFHQLLAKPAIQFVGETTRYVLCMFGFYVSIDSRVSIPKRTSVLYGHASDGDILSHGKIFQRERKVLGFGLFTRYATHSRQSVVYPSLFGQNRTHVLMASRMFNRRVSFLHLWTFQSPIYIQ